MGIGFIFGFIAGFTVAAILRAKIVETEEIDDYYAEEPFSSVFDEE